MIVPNDMHIFCWDVSKWLESAIRRVLVRHSNGPNYIIILQPLMMIFNFVRTTYSFDGVVISMLVDFHIPCSIVKHLHPG